MTATIRRREIGETREQFCWVQQGFYRLASDVARAVLIEVSEDDTLLIQIDVLAYAHPENTNPGWCLEGWREPTAEELAEARAVREERRRKRTQEIELSRAPRRTRWWQRCWYRLWHPFERRHRVPPAQLLEE